MDELMAQFVIEARELAETAANDLLALERNAKARDRLESLFRAVHTLKGSVGLFDLGPMHEVLHAAEEMLSAARSGLMEIDSGFVDPLLGVVEWTERCVENIEANGNLSKYLSDEAKRLLAGLSAAPGIFETFETPVISENEPSWATSAFARPIQTLTDGTSSLTAFRYVPHPQSFFNGDDPLAFVAQIPGLLALEMRPREPWADVEAFDPYKCNLILEGVANAPLADLVSIFRLIPDQITLIERQTPAEAASKAIEKTAPAMRVEPARIDRLVAIAGELVAAKNGLLPLASEAREAMGNELLSRRILENHKDIERLVGELYTAVTKARLVTLDHTFRRFPRLVRETASRLGKSVELVVEGGELEADREIVESLFEPLLHLVRNSLDHGLETSDERAASGKSATGKLSLLASQRGERIELVVSDDGRGLDADAIREVAVAKALLSQKEAASLSEDEAIALIFAPGFSTASSVSDLSGRGVGLDAVKQAIQLLGGKLGVSNSRGLGVKFVLQVPISFSMSRLIVVEVGGERFGVRLEVVVETLRFGEELVLPFRSGEAFVLRDRTLPLVRLARMLGVQSVAKGKDARILVCIVDGSEVGIVVDRVAERTETLTRPLSPMLQTIAGISGTTVTGDGRILLVLDLEAIAG